MGVGRVRLWRRRYIPDEIVELSDDEILSVSGDLIVTRWKTLRTKRNFVGGVSAYHIDKNVKVSKFLDEAGDTVFYYCDIIETEKKSDGLVFNDLLADVIVRTDGRVEVVDLGELADASDAGLIGSDTVKKALRALDWLLGEIYGGRFDRLVPGDNHSTSS